MDQSSRPSQPDDDDGPDERYADERVRHRARPWVGYVAVLLAASYAVLGVVVLLVPPARFPLAAGWRLGFGILLIVYGAVRVWRSYNRYYR